MSDEEGGLPDPDAQMLKAMISIGMMSVYGDVEGYREDAIEALRQLAVHLEDGDVPFIGSVRLALDMLDQHIEDQPAGVTDPYYELASEFSAMFVAGEPAPMLRLVEDDED